MTKRMFWPMFKTAWEQAFTAKNITSAYQKTGIFPFNPALLLDKIQRLVAQPIDNSIESTPLSCRAIRRVQKAYRKSLTKKRLSVIFRSNERLAAQHSIDQHAISGLVRALKYEKKKRSRGKRLNLMGEEDTGPTFWSPTKVCRALAYQDQKKTEEQQEKDRIVANKATAAANKVRKEQEKAERALRTAERRRVAAEKKIQHAVDVQARKELRQAAKTLRIDRIPPTKITKSAPKPKSASTKRKEPVVVAQNEVGSSQVKITTSCSRTTMRTIQGSK
jgi:hypothetical protein